MHRVPTDSSDHPMGLGDERNKDDSDKEDEKEQKKQMFKKKTKLYFDTYDRFAEAKDLRQREALPWIFEDPEGEIGFVGKLEGSQVNTNYVLFVYEVITIICNMNNINVVM